MHLRGVGWEMPQTEHHPASTPPVESELELAARPSDSPHLETWQTLSHELFEPTSKREYTALLEFTRRGSSEHSIDREPIKTLFWLACEYLRRWGKADDPWAKEPITSSMPQVMKTFRWSMCSR
jgi:hypothetical protein